MYYNAEERVQSSLLNVTESPNGNYYFQALNLANQERSVVAAEQLPESAILALAMPTSRLCRTRPGDRRAPTGGLDSHSPE